MRRGLAHMTVSVFAAVLLACSILQAQQTNDLRTWQERLLRQEESLFANYAKALDDSMASLKARGDLDTYLVVEAEKKRFEAEHTVPAYIDAKDAFRVAVGSHHRGMAEILRKYVTALDTRTKQETAAGRIDDAKAARDEKYRAESLLVDSQAKLPKHASDLDQRDQKEGFPSISGVWKETDGIYVTITQKKAQWTAVCTYTRPEIGEVRWEMKGSITQDGKIRGTLRPIKQPKNWAKSQVREGRLSKDGNTISGTAIWENGGHEFTWSRRMEEAKEPTK